MSLILLAATIIFLGLYLYELNDRHHIEAEYILMPKSVFTELRKATKRHDWQTIHSIVEGRYL